MKGKVDSPESFIHLLSNHDLRGEKRYEMIASLRVALTNNPVRWVKHDVPSCMFHWEILQVSTVADIALLNILEAELIFFIHVLFFLILSSQ